MTFSILQYKGAKAGIAREQAREGTSLTVLHEMGRQEALAAEQTFQ